MNPERVRPPGGFTLIEVLVGVLAVVIVLALFLPAWSRARRHGRIAACMDHLRQLHRAESAWESAHPGDPPGAGKAYWTKLAKGTSPLADRKILACPLASPPEGPDGCAYWGPAGDTAKMDPADPLGCDAPDNHGEHGHEGGNVLRKSGEVLNDNREIWWGAAKRGKCSP